MSIQINGTSGISGVDGSATTPALQGTDTNTGLTFGTNTVGVVTDGTTAVTVDSSQNVGIGTSTPASDALLTLQGTNRNIFFQADGAPTDCAIDCAGGRFVFRGGASGTTVASIGEQMRLDENGRLLVGETSSTQAGSIDAKAQIVSNDFNAALTVRRNQTGDGAPGMLFCKSRGTSNSANVVVSSGDGLGNIRFFGADATGGNDFAEGGAISCVVDGNAGSNDMPGRLEFKTTSDGSDGPTERMRISSDGSVFIAKTGYGLGTAGHELQSNGVAYHTSATARVLIVNKTSGDGILVGFYKNTVEEGNISVSGSTVQLNGAHLSRWSQLPGNAERTEILRGSVLSNLDEMCEWAYDAEPEVLWAEGDELPEGVSVGDVKTPAKAAGTEDNEQLNRMKVSDVEGDKNVAGVFVSWDDDDDTYTNDFYCAMTGDFVIRIAQGVTVQRGDLLMSAGDGTAKPQDDDIIRSKTIAKVTSTNVSCTYDDGSYCVPCVLMAC